MLQSNAYTYTEQKNDYVWYPLTQFKVHVEKHIPQKIDQ